MNEQERRLLAEQLLLSAINSNNPRQLNNIANDLADCGYLSHAAAVRSKARQMESEMKREAERAARLQRSR